MLAQLSRICRGIDRSTGGIFGDLRPKLWSLFRAPVFIYTRAGAIGRTRLVSLLGILVILAVGLGANLIKPVQTAAATSNTVNFQARLQLTNGSIVPDGWYNVEFKLYNVSSGGSAQWTEDYIYNSGSATTCGGPLGVHDCRVQVIDGYLTADLGSLTAFSGINWDQQEWLTMNIGGTVTSGSYPAIGDGEMSPRLKLTAVPYAFRAGQLADPANSGATLTWAAQGAANSILLPNAAGTLCLQSAAACGFALNPGSGFYLQQVPTSNTPGASGANIIAPTLANIVGLTVKGTTGTAAHVIDIYNSSGSPTLQDFFDSAGSLNVGQLIQPTSNNTLDLGVVTTGTFRTGYFGTSLNVNGATLTNAALTFSAASANSVNGTSGQSLTLQSQGTGQLILNSANNGIALQTAGTTQAILTSGNLTFQQASTIKTVSGGSGLQLTIQGGANTGGIGGNLLLQGGTGAGSSASGSVIVQSNGNNSSTAFQVQNGTSGILLNADTSKMRIAIDASTISSLSSPGAPSFTQSGSPAANPNWAASTTYFYKITAIDATGGETTASTEASIVNPTVTSNIKLTWSPVTAAAGYRIYRGTSSGGESGYYSTVGSSISGSSNISFIDTNATQNVGSVTPPTTNTSTRGQANGSGALQLAVGYNGTPVGQLYVSGTQPTSAIGTANTGSAPFNEYISGHYAYVINNQSANFQIFDISNPQSINLVGTRSTSTNGSDIAVEGNYAFVTTVTDKTLEVYDVSNPTSPSFVSLYKLKGTPSGRRSLFISGRYAFVNENNNNVEMIDISNPASPVNISSIPAGCSILSFYVSDNWLFIGCSGTGPLVSVNIPWVLANPTNPAAGSYNLANASVGSMFVQGKYLYGLGRVGSQASDCLNIFDISDPTNIKVDGNWTNASGQLYSVYVQGRYAYVTNTTNNSISTVDISNPLLPFSISSVSTANFPISVNAQGRYAYVINWSSGSLQSFDVGGAYIQQLEAGGIQTGTLNVTNNSNINGDENIQGGLTVGTNTQLDGYLGVTGNSFFMGSTSLAGGILGGATINGISTPSAPTITFTGTIGTSTTYTYAVVAVSASGGVTPASSTGTISSGDTVFASMNTNNFNTISWSPVNGAVSYKVYRTVGGTSQGLIGTTSSSFFNDTGIAASGSAPTLDSSGQLNVNGFATFKNTTNSITAFQVNNAAGTNLLAVDTTNSQVLLGQASTVTGKLLFKGSGGAGTLALKGPDTPNVGNFTLSIPAITANANVCTDNSICSGYAAAATSANYLQQVPTNNSAGTPGANIIAPTANGVVGLTVNGTTGTAATALNVIQGGATTALQVTQNGNTTASSSTGGSINLNNTNNTGAGLVIYSNQASPQAGARLLSVRSDNPSFFVDAANILQVGTGAGLSINKTNVVTGVGTGAGDGLFINDDSGGGSIAGHGVEIRLTGTGNANSNAANIQSLNSAASAVAISGVETAKGTINIIHTGSSIDGNASGLAIDLQGSGTAAQGIFLDASGGGTTGKLLNLRNNGTELLTLNASGQLGLGVGGVPSATLDVRGNALFRNNSNTTTAFQIQNSTSGTLLNADTTNMRLGVDVTYAVMGTPSISNSTTTQPGGTLAQNTTYYYEVTAVDAAGGESLPSTQRAQLTGNTNALNTITITWAPITGAAGYHVYRSINSGNFSSVGYYSTLGSVSGANLTFTDTNATLNNTSATPPSGTGTAYVSTNVSNKNLQLSVGGNGTPTGQFYVSGTVPSSALGSANTSTGPINEYVSGNYDYVVNYGSSNLQIFDISNPASINLVGSISTSTNPFDVVVEGSTAYVVTITGTFESYDVSNPAQPTLIKIYNLANPPLTFASRVLTIQGKYAFVIEGFNVEMIDISNPLNPIHVSTIVTTCNVSARATYASGNWLYIGCGNSTNPMVSVNIPQVVANPNSPSIHPYANVFVNDLYIQGKYMYTVGKINGQASNELNIFDISDPTNFKVDGSVVTPGTGAFQLNVQGRYAYLVNQNNSISTYDVSNPNNPTLVGSVSTNTTPAAVRVQGRYAFVTNYGSNTIQSYDVGGAYIQQLETGGIQTSTLSVTNNSNFNGDVTIQGGQYVGGNSELQGSLGVAGSSMFTGSTTLAGGILGGATINGLSTPFAPTVTTVGCPAACTNSWGYEVVAINASGGTTLASAQGTTTGSNGYQNLQASFYNQITWNQVPGAVAYNVYRTSIPGGGQVNGVAATTGLISVTPVTTGFINDTGITASGSTPSLDSSGQFTVNGFATFKNTTNSITAFQVQNQAGANILDVNTSNSRVGINTAAPTADLSFGNGASRTINVLDAASGNGNSLTIQAGNSQVPGAANGGNLTLQAGSSLGTGIGGDVNIISGSSAGNNSGNASGNINLSTPFAGSNPNGSGNITLTTGGTYTNPGNIILGTGVAGATGNTGAITFQQAGSTVAQFSGTFGNRGSLLLQNLENSTFALQVKNVAGATLLNADTTNMRLGVDVTYASLAIPISVTGTACSASCPSGSLINGTTYYYEVTALDANGGQTTASAQSAGTAATATHVINVTWNTVPAAKSYEVYRTTSSGSYGSAVDYLVNATGNAGVATFQDTGATNIYSGPPPNTSTAYQSTNIANTNNLELSIGGNGTPTGQLYVSGTIPTSAIGTAITDANPYAIFVKSNYAYVVGQGTSTFQVYDISNPSNPTKIANPATTALPIGVYVAGKYAYVAETNAFQIFDITNPSTPVSVYSNATLPSNPVQVYVQGKYAYLVAGGSSSGGLMIFDVSNPVNTTMINRTTICGGTITVTGNYAYIGCSQNSFLTPVNISNPYNPVVGTQVALPNTAPSTYVQGRYLYVAGGTSQFYFNIYDISNPSTPQLVSTSFTTSQTRPHQIFVQGNYAYVALETETAPSFSSFAIFDISNPANVNVNTPLATIDLDRTEAVNVQGRYAYVLSYNLNKMSVLDLGGEYTAQLQAGAAQLSTLQVDTNANITGDTNIQGNLNVGQSLQATSLGLSGQATISGSTILGGGLNILSAPTGFSVTSTCSSSCVNYSYVVTAVNSTGGETTASSTQSVNGSNPLNGINPNNNLTWNLVSGANAYKIYRTASSGSPSTTGYIGTLANSSCGGTCTFADSGIPGTSANAPTYNSSGQLTVNGTALINTSTNSTTAFQIQGSAGSSATLLNADTTNMRLGVDVTYAAMGTPSISNSTTTQPGGTLAQNTTYFYEITALDAAGGESSPSAQRSQLTGNTNALNTITLTWAPISGASGYHIYRSTTSGNFTGVGYYSTLGTVSGANLTFTDTNATKNNTSATPPGTTTAYVSTNISNNNLQLSVGGNGTPTGQVYVSGTVPSSALTTFAAASNPQSVVVQGRFAYVAAAGASVLQVIDISNPISPTSLGSVSTAGGPVASLAVSGRYAYMLCTHTIQVIDVSNPLSVPVVGTVSIGASQVGKSIYVQGRYAYVATSTTNSLEVFDISNPYNPILVGSVTTGSGTNGVFASGRYAYVINATANTLQVIDVSTPTTPTITGSVALGNTTGSIFVQGRYAYVTTGSAQTMQVIDINNPAGPVITGSIAALGSTTGSVYVQGRYAYVLAGNTLKFIDVSNPISPVAITGGSVATGNGPDSVYVLGRYAYVTNGTDSSLQTFDLGGEYAQQLQVGGTETGTLQVDTNAIVSGDETVQGGIYVGQSSQIGGNLNVLGGSNLQGSVIVNGFGPPTITALNCNTSVSACNTSTTWTYLITSVNSSGNESAAGGSNTISTNDCSTLSATCFNSLSWFAVAGASSYNVYRTVAGGTPNSTGYLGNTASTGFTDQGTAATTRTAPTISSTGQLTVNGSTLLQSNSTTALQILNSTGTSLFNADTANGRVGINNSAPGNLLSIGALTTAAGTYQIAVSTGATTNSGILVQTVASQSNTTNIFQAQDSTGAALATIDYTGNLTVKAATVNGNLTLNGHEITGNTSGSTTAAIQSAAGTGGSPACTISGNDTGGQITLKTGTSAWGTGAQCIVTFANSFGSAPHPVLTAASSVDSTAVKPYLTSGTTTFTINFINADTAQHTFTFNYFNTQ